jgi:hypothetical protein
MADPIFILPLADPTVYVLGNVNIPRYLPIIPDTSDTPLPGGSLNLNGVPVFDQLEFVAPAASPNGNAIYPTVNLVMQTVILEVNMTRNIVKTVIQGRNGTIKEYISDGDYMITVRGAIVAKTNVYPKFDVAQLVNYCQIQDSITVKCSFLNDFHIQSLVIDSYNIAQKVGYRNMVPFELNCSSDTDLGIQLK